MLPYDRYFDSWMLEFERFCKKQKDKLPDFMDRIDAIIRIPPICREMLGNGLGKEYEDLAIMLIKKNFGGVKFIGKWALKAICDELTRPNSMRKAEKMIFSSRLRETENFDLQCIPRQFRRDADAVRGELEPAWEIRNS